MKNTKYELTDETIRWYGRDLYRIRALRDMYNKEGTLSVSKGDLGGFVQSEKNLSVSDDSWIQLNAKVYGNAVVSGSARVTDDAEVYDNAYVTGGSSLYHNCKVSGDCTVKDTLMNMHARVHGKAEVTNSSLGGMIRVGDNAVIRNSKLIDYGLEVFIGENACIQSYRDVVEMAGVGLGGCAIVAYRVTTADMVAVQFRRQTYSLNDFVKQFKGKDPDMDSFINMVELKLYL